MNGSTFEAGLKHLNRLNWPCVLKCIVNKSQYESKNIYKSFCVNVA